MPGYHAELTIHTARTENKTRPTKLFYSAPYKLMNYFETPSGGIEYIIMNASAGIMAGDQYKMNVHVGEQSQLTLLPQSFEKIHKMDVSAATRQTTIVIEKNSYFKYIPLPTIPFANSDFQSCTRIELADASSTLLYADIVSCGRVSQERFLFRRYESRTEIYLADQLVFRDYCAFIPIENTMEGYGFFEGYSYIGNLFVYGFALMESIQEQIGTCLQNRMNSQAAITALLGGGYLIRIFSHQSETLLQLFSTIIKVIEREVQCLN